MTGRTADPAAAGPELPAAGASHRLWGGRSAEGPAPTLEELNRSLPVDRRLWREDIEASRAWVQALARVGVLEMAEARILDRGLLAVYGRIERGAADDAPDEDIHTLVERLLYEEVGDVAGKLHTGRSRNDQVATDARLWAARATARLDRELHALESALLERASATIDVLMPSYTHMRRAQPVRVAHWLLAHFWALDRDRQRLAAAMDRVSVLPLGSGAITGSGFAVDRTLLKELLGFRGISENSLDAVGDRDWICELLFVAAMIGTHISRLAEDLIIFSTDEFGFVVLPDAYTTGSSLMPQKRNPDGLELARGMAARLIGHLTAALAMLKSLPSGYNKDLQEDKKTLFDALDALLLLLPATRETIAALEFRTEVMAKALEDEALTATDLADALVRRGVPFREAHGAVGRLLRAAERAGVQPGDLPDRAWAEAHPAFVAPERPRAAPLDSVETRTVPGGTARTAVVTQLERARTALASPS
ncbi:MAG: argininosuccinate lyase [Gemmatimonadetes bacterium]|nr:argininosuccinate lyase [Gemmatimonadota bacterium]